MSIEIQNAGNMIIQGQKQPQGYGSPQNRSINNSSMPQGFKADVSNG